MATMNISSPDLLLRKTDSHLASIAVYAAHFAAKAQ